MSGLVLMVFHNEARSQRQAWHQNYRQGQLEKNPNCNPESRTFFCRIDQVMQKKSESQNWCSSSLGGFLMLRGTEDSSCLFEIFMPHQSWWKDTFSPPPHPPPPFPAKEVWKSSCRGAETDLRSGCWERLWESHIAERGNLSECTPFDAHVPLQTQMCFSTHICTHSRAAHWKWWMVRTEFPSTLRPFTSLASPLSGIRWRSSYILAASRET